MKKLIVAALVAVMSVGMVSAAPHGRIGHRGFHHARPVHHIHHHSGWGRGGCHFWPGFVGGLVGGIIYDSIATAPIVTTPVVINQTVTPVTKVEQVWVEGKYVTQIDANGKAVQVWQPGHYEQRTVIIQ